MDDLIAFLTARLSEREEIAKAALVRGGSEWGLKHKHQDWWSGDADPELIVGGKPLAKFNEEYGGAQVARHVLATQPKHELADIAAKRQIIDEHQNMGPDDDAVCGTCYQVDRFETVYGDWPCKTLRLLALPFAGHPDYREGWAPEDA